MPGPRPNWRLPKGAVSGLFNSIGTALGIYYVVKELKDLIWGTPVPAETKTPVEITAPVETPEAKFDREAVANLKMTPEEEASVKATYPDSTEAQQRAAVYEQRKLQKNILIAQIDENFKELHKAPNITKDEPKAPDL